jgi:hypothetical protein
LSDGPRAAAWRIPTKVVPLARRADDLHAKNDLPFSLETAVRPCFKISHKIELI